MKTITEKQARRTRTVGVHRVEPTLYLRVQKSGSKSFVQKLTIGSKRVEIGLGGFPAVSFTEARKQATLNRAAVMMGNDPRSNRTVRAEAFKPTFAELNDATYKAKLPTWKGGTKSSTATHWQGSMSNYVLGRIGSKPIDQIGRDDVLGILVPLWEAKPAAGRRLVQRMESVFAHAIAAGHIDSNVVTLIRPALPKATASQNHRALPWQDIPAALDAIRESGASVAASLCLEWLILTASRSCEARGADWSEIDREAGTWTIPAERMKAGQAHVVPLTDAMLDVLDRVEAIRENGLVFPSPRCGGLVNSTLHKVLIAAGLKDRATIHGFRSAFRTWAAERGAVREVAEQCLAHQTGSAVELAYQRSTMLDRRRPLMAAWSGHCTATPAKVIAIGA